VTDLTELEGDEFTALDDELSQEARGAIWGSWTARQECRGRISRFLGYAEGTSGIPDIDDVSDELQTIARQSVINMIGVAIDAFADGLAVVGYRSPSDVDNEPAWKAWQRSGMDARQSEVIRPALTYGWSFCSVLPDDTMDGKARMAAWSPLDVVADYDDPRRDLFPERAMLLRAVEGGWSVLLVDDTMVQPGFIEKRSKQKVRAADVILTGDAWAHGATWLGRPICPVIRFLNERPTDDRAPRGVVEPLISKQRSINSANFDRLVNSRFGAFQQMVVIGWQTTKQTLLRTSATRAMAFEDHPDDLTVTKLSASPMEPYNALIRELKEEFALVARIPIPATGLSNVSLETAAMAENAHQRRLTTKRDSFGESWEQALRVAVVMDGGEEPSDSAEAVWRETEVRSFAAVVDGVVKLASIPSDAGGVPVEDLLDLIPGMEQTRIDSIRDSLVRRRSGGMLTALTGMLNAAPAAPVDALAASVADTSEMDQANTQKAKFDALGVAIRAGVEPDDAAARLGLMGIKFTGAVPVSLRLPTADAAALEVT